MTFCFVIVKRRSCDGMDGAGGTAIKWERQGNLKRGDERRNERQKNERHLETSTNLTIFVCPHIPNL